MQAGMSLQWRKHPFLRILLPLMVGIVVGDVFYCSFLGLTIAAICCFFFLFFPIRFWIAADMWFCILGMWLVSFHREKVQFSFPNKELVYEGVLVDSPQKSKTQLFSCTIKFSRRFCTKNKLASKGVALYAFRYALSIFILW